MSYALAWGNQVAHGELPNFDAPLAPTPHPLSVAVGAVISPLDTRVDAVMGALHVLAFGAMVVATFRLGEALFSAAAGAVAAAVMAACVPLIELSSRGVSDPPAVALILWALVIEVRSPRRGWPVFVLLAVAGLLRPEAWLYTAAYWLYLTWDSSWGDRLRWAAIGAVAPVLWALTDLVATGDPLWSLTGTRALTEQLGEEVRLAAVPIEGSKLIARLLGLGAPLAAVGGLLIGLRRMRSGTRLAVAIAALNGVAFAGFAVAGTALNSRYLLLAAVMVALLAGVGAVAGYGASRPRLRSGYGAISAACGIALLLGVFAFQLGRFERASDGLVRERAIRSDLIELLGNEAVRAAEGSCGPLDVPHSRVLPVVAYLTDRSPAEIFAVSVSPRSHRYPGLVPRTAAAARTETIDPRELVEGRPEGQPTLAEHGHWAVVGRCPASSSR